MGVCAEEYWMPGLEGAHAHGIEWESATEEMICSLRIFRSALTPPPEITSHRPQTHHSIFL
eukprot:scaffold3109_cov156-Skeletonema_marinoi.AAC.1